MVLGYPNQDTCEDIGHRNSFAIWDDVVGGGMALNRVVGVVVLRIWFVWVERMEFGIRCRVPKMVGRRSVGCRTIGWCPDGVCFRWV